MLFLRDEEQNTYSQGVKLNLKLRLLVERDEQTGRWSAVFPELPGCASAGDTETEAIANAREALELWFELLPSRPRVTQSGWN
jgi:predicted RNase H-like HicB family nuclease